MPADIPENNRRGQRVLRDQRQAHSAVLTRSVPQESPLSPQDVFVLYCVLQDLANELRKLSREQKPRSETRCEDGEVTRAAEKGTTHDH